MAAPAASARAAARAAAVAFFVGLLVATVVFFARRPFSWADAIISDIESPEENPRAYWVAAVGTAVCGGYLLRVAYLAHRVVRLVSPRLAAVGAAAATLGALSAVSLGGLAPFAVSYESVHIPLAFLAFIGTVAGLAINLGIVARQARTRRLLYAYVAIKLAVLGGLVYIYFTPQFFDGRSVLTTLAIWEWTLCGLIAVSVSLLATAIDRPRP